MVVGLWVLLCAGGLFVCYDLFVFMILVLWPYLWLLWVWFGVLLVFDLDVALGLCEWMLL